MKEDFWSSVKEVIFWAWINFPVDVIPVFLAAFLAYYYRIKADERKQKITVKRLARVIYEEVEQSAEILSIDINIDKDFFNNKSDNDVNRIKEKINFVIKNNVMFKSNSDRIIMFKGYLPNSITKFYLNCENKGGELLYFFNTSFSRGGESNYENYKSLRLSLEIEAEALKADLRKIMD